jgi:hypothetical protein
MKKSLPLLLIIALFSSCDKELEIKKDKSEILRGNDWIKNIDDSSSLLIGKWKLDTLGIVGLRVPEIRFFCDHTLDNIIYEFEPFHVLTVTVDMNQVDLYKGLDNGTHSYLLETITFGSSRKMKSFFINDEEYVSFNYSTTKLEIQKIDEYDWTILRLVKIE